MNRESEREKERDIHIADERRDIEIRVFIPRSVQFSSLSHLSLVFLPSVTLQLQKQSRIFIRVLWFKSHTPQYSPIVAKELGGARSSQQLILCFIFMTLRGSFRVPRKLSRLQYAADKFYTISSSIIHLIFP